MLVAFQHEIVVGGGDQIRSPAELSTEASSMPHTTHPLTLLIESLIQVRRGEGFMDLQATESPYSGGGGSGLQAYSCGCVTYFTWALTLQRGEGFLLLLLILYIVSKKEEMGQMIQVIMQLPKQVGGGGAPTL